MNRSSKVMLPVGAAVALAIGATGGAVGAQLVTSAQIKNGTIQTADLSPAVVRKLNQAGPRGPAGQAGSKGAAGRDGTNGTFGKITETVRAIDSGKFQAVSHVSAIRVD